MKITNNENCNIKINDKNVDATNKEKDYKAMNKITLDMNGYEAQFPIWIEEMSELTKELCKYHRGRIARDYEKINTAREHLIEEYVDVCICLEQIKHYYDISNDDYQKWYEYKVTRQFKRMMDNE